MRNASVTVHSSGESAAPQEGSVGIALRFIAGRPAQQVLYSQNVNSYHASNPAGILIPNRQLITMNETNQPIRPVKVELIIDPATGIENARLAAAKRGASLVQAGMLVGLGSGRASAEAIRQLGERMWEEKLQFTGVPTSKPSRNLALELGIPLVAPEEVGQLDLTLDGADEADSNLNVIKGGGGALVREKLLARSSTRLVLMIESPKWVEKLGQFHLPIAVIPFAWQSTAGRVRQHCQDLTLRMKEGQPYRTDDGLLILDLVTGPIEDPAALERALKAEVGVAEVGLFIGLCDHLIIGQQDGTITEHQRGPAL